MFLRVTLPVGVFLFLFFVTLRIRHCVGGVRFPWRLVICVRPHGPCWRTTSGLRVTGVWVISTPVGYVEVMRSSRYSGQGMEGMCQCFHQCINGDSISFRSRAKRSNCREFRLRDVLNDRVFWWQICNKTKN